MVPNLLRTVRARRRAAVRVHERRWRVRGRRHEGGRLVAGLHVLVWCVIFYRIIAWFAVVAR